MTLAEILLQELHALSRPTMTALVATKKPDDLILADQIHRHWNHRQELLSTVGPQRFQVTDHDEIARILDERGDVSHRRESFDIMIGLCTFFQKDNPNFDILRFQKLSGMRDPR